MKKNKTQLLILLSLIFSLGGYAQTVKTVWDKGGTLDDGMTLDDKGNLFVSNYYGGQVYRLGKKGVEIISEGEIKTPNGLATDSKGNLYVSDLEGNKIHKITPDGNRSVLVDNINYPSGIIRSPFGGDTLYFAQYEGKISKLTTDGQVIPWLAADTTNGINSSIGLAADEQKNFYIAGYATGMVHKITPDLKVTLLAAIPLGGDEYPTLGYIDYSKGYIYATSIGLHHIYKIDLQGNVSLYAGTTKGDKDGPISEAQFDLPNGILASFTGDTIYVTDWGTKNLRMIIGVNDTIPLSIPLSLTTKTNLKISVKNSQLSLAYQLNAKAKIAITLYNLQGKKMGDIYNGWVLKGTHTNKHNMNNLPKGVYLVEWINMASQEKQLLKAILDQ